MDCEVRWSPEATEDLESIAEYITRDSEFYARAVVSEILSVSRDICNFPLAGRVVPEMDDKSIRERLIYSYRLVYRVEPEQILVIAVIHGKRVIENIAGRIHPKA